MADKFTVHSDEDEYPLSVFFDDWNSETVYPKAGVVNYNGCTWTSRKDGNKGNIPSSTSDCWVSNKGEAGKDAYKLEVISSAGLVYHNNTISTVLSAHIYGSNGEVTDKCNGTFTWYDVSGSSPIQKGTGKTLTVTTPSGTALERYRFRCKYDGDIPTNN